MDRIDESDEKEHRMTAPLLERYTEDEALNGYYLVNKEDVELFEQIESTIRELPPSEKDFDYRRLWISVPRGTIEDFADYEDYKEDGWTYEEFVEYWKGRYPDNEDWYVFHHENVPRGGRYIALGRLVIFCGDEHNSYRKPSYYHTDVLKWLTVVLRKQVDSVKAGTYHDKIVKELPIGYRRGVVRRSDVWESGYWTREFDLDGTTDEDIERFEELVNGGIGDKPKDRIPSMTVNDYLALCSLCFRIRGENTEGLSLKEQYEGFADGRDDGMLDIDPDDPDAFEKFHRESHSGHIWEIRSGHGFSWMHLFPRKDDEGWYTVLSGPFDRTDFIHIALGLYDNGIPVKVDEAAKVLKAIKGEDFIGIVPRDDFPHYCEYLFTKHDVLDCVSFRDKMMEKFGDKIEWYDVNTFYPVKEQ